MIISFVVVDSLKGNFIIIIALLKKSFNVNFAAECPLSSKMTTCSPKCKDDTECFGQKCCPNICNTKSCTTGNQLSSSNAGYKDSKSKLHFLFDELGLKWKFDFSVLLFFH